MRGRHRLDDRKFKVTVTEDVARAIIARFDLGNGPRKDRAISSPSG